MSTEEEQIKILREILKWIKFSGIREVRSILMNILDTEEKRLIYHLSNGENGSVEIGRRVGVSHVTVTRYWKSWTRLGIVDPIRVQGGLRYKRLFELNDFGFSMPAIRENEVTD